MNAHMLREPGFVAGAAGLALVIAGTGIYLTRRKKPTAEELERRRRDYLVTHGRLIDGTVLDIDDRFGPGTGKPSEKIVFYKYEIAGVSYESSQDVTLLPEQMEVATSKPGFPASVRYDPHNPMNSIVLAEGWNGMRHSSATVARLNGKAPHDTIPAPLA